MTKIIRFGLIAALALAAAACGGSGSSGGDFAESAPAMSAAPPVMAAPAPPMDAFKAVDQAGPPGGAGQGGDPLNPPDGRLIAYSYHHAFRAPTGRIEGLLAAHKAACDAAGPSRCYVVASQVNGLGTEYASGSLEMRGAPDWVRSFRAGLPESLEAFDAEQDGHHESSEDLTAQIIDQTAWLNAQKTLRDRLQAMLRDRPGSLAELLEVERELARVQGGIDSAESVLAAMRLRVSMSAVSLSYSARYSAASESLWRPLGDAFSGFLGNIVSAFAAVVEFVSLSLPWLIVVAGLAWFAAWLWRWLRRRPSREAKARAAAQAAAGHP
jgi:hypothetical protein